MTRPRPFALAFRHKHLDWGVVARKTEKRRYRTSPATQQARAERSEIRAAQIESTALELFERRGFSAVTVDDIAAAAGIGARTFYRHFPAKEDVLRVLIRHRARALEAALARQPLDVPPLRAVRVAVEDVISDEDAGYVERWIRAVEASPEVTRLVLGDNIVELNSVLREFLVARLETAPDALEPAMLAVAAGAIIQASQTRWHFEGGDLARTVGEALLVLEDTKDVTGRGISGVG